MIKFEDLKIGDRVVRSNNLHGDTYVLSKELHIDHADRHTILLDNEFGAVKKIPFIIEWDDDKKFERYP